jgi:hypothetical protein
MVLSVVLSIVSRYHEPVNTRAAANSIARLQGFRVRARPDPTVGSEVATQLAAIEVRAKQWGGWQMAWERAVPDALQQSCRIHGYARGVLHVHARDTASRYLLDRWLRAGGEKQLRACGNSPLQRVAVTVYSK